jgi:hypothetical protein
MVKVGWLKESFSLIIIFHLSELLSSTLLTFVCEDYPVLRPVFVCCICFWIVLVQFIYLSKIYMDVVPYFFIQFPTTNNAVNDTMRISDIEATPEPSVHGIVRFCMVRSFKIN